MKTITVLACAALLITQPIRAQVPQIVNYQGRVAVDGVNFEGTGQFKFALVDGGTNTASTAKAVVSVDGTGKIKSVSVTIPGSGYSSPPMVTFTDPGGLGSGATATAVVGAGGIITAINVTNAGSGYLPPGPLAMIADPPPAYVYNTYWSNDKSLVAGSGNTEPTNAVGLTVTKGLYSVPLGDASLANMTGIPTGVFNNSDVRLRVWFNDGIHGSQLLAPDQRLAAVGYAMIATTVPDGAITSSKLANGAVGSTQLGANAVQSGNIATGAVGPAQIANNAVTAASIATGAVGSTQLGANAASANTAGTVVLRDASGGFSAGTLSLDRLDLPTTTATRGTVTIGGVPVLQSFGVSNFFAGPNAGNISMEGYGNTAIGDSALSSNTLGYQNTASGTFALLSNTTGTENTASGSSALYSNTEGSRNTASGDGALASNTEGVNNTASGYGALYYNTTGSSNTACGHEALIANSTGSLNTTIGSGADVGANNLTNATAIGANAIANASNKIRLGDGNVSVLECKVGLTVTSDRNQKENFLPVDEKAVLEKVRSLSLTSWNYIGQDAQKFRHYGPMAQDFFAAFGHDAVGTSGTDTTINSSDMAGIMMCAIQALATENVAVREENAALKKQLTDRLVRLEQRLAAAPAAARPDSLPATRPRAR